MKHRHANLYDPATGSHLMTVKEAADYLDYHPFSIYRLIWSKDLRPVKTAGKVKLFLKEDLDKFKATGKWTKRKPSLSIKPADFPTEWLAKVSIPWGPGDIPFLPGYTIENFTWDKIPLIRAGVIEKHGDIPFNVEISTKEIDGPRWSITYNSPSWSVPGVLQKWMKKRKANRERPHR